MRSENDDEQNRNQSARDMGSILQVSAQVTIPGYARLYPEPLDLKNSVQGHFSIDKPSQDYDELNNKELVNYDDITASTPSYFTLDGLVYHVPQAAVAKVRKILGI